MIYRERDSADGGWCRDVLRLAVCLNDDAMHKPAWGKPVVFKYGVRME